MLEDVRVGKLEFMIYIVQHILQLTYKKCSLLILLLVVLFHSTDTINYKYLDLILKIISENLDQNQNFL